MSVELLSSLEMKTLDILFQNKGKLIAVTHQVSDKVAKELQKGVSKQIVELDVKYEVQDAPDKLSVEYTSAQVRVSATWSEKAAHASVRINRGAHGTALDVEEVVGAREVCKAVEVPATSAPGVSFLPLSSIIVKVLRDLTP